MNLASSPVFRAEDFPDTDPNLLDVLNRMGLQLRNAIAQQPDRGLANGSFTSAASGVSTVSVKNQLVTKPKHFNVALRRDDLSDFAAAWSWWYALEGDSIKLSFIGLPASAKLVYSVEYL